LKIFDLILLILNHMSYLKIISGLQGA